MRDVRNLTHAQLEPSPHLNVIAGQNGHGKTSLLESIYLAATSKSFRTHTLGDLVRHGAEQARVSARWSEQASDGVLRREQVVVVSGGRTTALLDDKRPQSLAEFATRSPVVAFHPDELGITTGPAQRRRTLLDRVALFLDPTSADHRARYARALKNRQLLLGQRSRSSEHLAQLDAFEELCAVHGAALTSQRARAVQLLQREILPAFTAIAAPGLELRLAYGARGTTDVDTARRELFDARAKDAGRPTASFGPHRDDLLLSLDGSPLKKVGSQGQHRAIVLALKIAETACIASLRAVEPVMLLDDVSSELDPLRNAAFFRLLARRQGQIFVTTTRPDLIDPSGDGALERRDFEVISGRLERR